VGEGREKQLVGESIIDDILFMTPDMIVKEFGDQLFISTDELNAYGGNRPEWKKLLVLSLSRFGRYDVPLNPPKVVTMAGCKLSEEEHRKLMKKAKVERSEVIQ
jgi:hypothetical protein